MLLSELQDLGLSQEEAKVYLSVLELGGAAVSTIAKKAGVHRVSCYHTLDNLVGMGLVSTLSKNKVKYFTVESPKILVKQMESRFAKAEKLLPELMSLTNALAYKPKIQYYEGAEGVKNIMEDTLTAEGEIVGYTNLAKVQDVLSEAYIKDYSARKLELGLRSRMLSPMSEDAIKYTERFYPKNYDKDLLEILFVNKDQFMFEYEINIYGNKVSVISLNSDELIGLIIESPVYAKTQRAVFDLAWLGATSFVAR
jgi:sugar-specific transcriptional regulator TrmB